MTTNDVDRLAVATCQAFGSQLEEGNQVVPLRYLKSSVLQALTLNDAVLQFAEDNDVTPSAAYRREVDANETSAGDLPADQVEAVVLLRTSSTLIDDVLGQVGAKTSAGSLDPTSDEAKSAGGQAFGTWIDDHEIEVDPQYDVQITSAGAEAADTSISYPVGDVAKAGAAEEPDQAATMTLPASQRCGSYDPAVATADSGGVG